MTDGLAAAIRDIIEVPFARPRRRAAIVAHASYEGLRDRLLGLLEPAVTKKSSRLVAGGPAATA